MPDETAPSATEIMLSLLNATPEPALAMDPLVRGGQLMGLTENNVRVAISRLRARGLVQSVRRGVYTLGPAARQTAREVRSWRTRQRRALPSWRGQYVIALGEASAEPSLERALRRLGFRKLETRAHVRPHNLRGGLRWLRRQLEALELAAPPSLARLCDPPPALDARVAALYDGAALDHQYRDLHGRLTASLARIPGLPAEDAMRESFLLGREAIRTLVVDPLLPAPLVDVDARAALHETMIVYDDRARPLWIAAMKAPPCP